MNRYVIIGKYYFFVCKMLISIYTHETCNLEEYWDELISVQEHWGNIFFISNTKQMLSHNRKTMNK